VCLKPADVGGEFLLADGRQMLRNTELPLLKELYEKKVSEENATRAILMGMYACFSYKLMRVLLVIFEIFSSIWLSIYIRAKQTED
jgi:uncharacterized membrane protein